MYLCRDLRRAITTLQSLSIAFCGENKKKEDTAIEVEGESNGKDEHAMDVEEKNEITAEDVKELCGVIPQKIINDFVEVCFVFIW